MKRRPLILAAVAALSTATTLSISAAHAAPSATGVSARDVAVCPTPQNELSARCHAILHERLNSDGTPAATAGTPSGYGPADLQAAYGLATASANNGAGHTVALVDAYDDPNAAADVATYRSQYNLPALSTCTVTTTSVTSPGGAPCFAKVNQSAVAGSYPQTNGGWAQEESLDVDMVSAVCPKCNIVLVEASSASFTNLGTAVRTAANFGAVAISNSYGSSGDASDSSYGIYYNHPGIAVTASTGDNGYGVGYPATSDYVVAVGGTSLSNAGGVYTETAWSGAGSGCSTYQSKPSWQPAVVQSACGGTRGIADVSAVADPNTGVAVYDSFSYQGLSGWLVFGGTSVASPVIASVYALAGVSTNYPASVPYANPSALHDVSGGSNGTCSTAVLCNAVGGWDGPTGLGTPNGLAAFGGSGSTGGTTPPAAPTNLTATAGAGSVGLTWTGSTGATSYNVFRGTTAGGEGTTPLATGVTTTSYTDTAVTAGTYYYTVAAVNSGGQGPMSNEASATPTAPTTTLMGATVSYAATSKALTVTVHVASDSNASVSVAGASVSITINLNGSGVASGSGTTGSNGNVSFRLNHPRSGTYTTHINSLTATGYTWDGAQPANSYP